MRNEILEKMENELDKVPYVVAGIDAFSVGAQYLGDTMKDQAISGMRVYAEYLDCIHTKLCNLVEEAKKSKEGCK